MPLFNRLINASIQLKNGTLINLNGFKMSFNIKKTSSQDPNTCQLTIANLNATTRNLINEAKALLTVRAGYQDESGDEIIFIGNITLVSSSNEFPGIITNIEASDGYEALSNVKGSFSFAKGSNIKQILKFITQKFPIGNKTNLDNLQFSNKSFNTGFSFVGKIKDAIDTLTQDAGLHWSVQNNELKFYTDNDKSFAIKLNKNTGLVRSPERIKIQKNSKEKEEEIDGWKIFSLLQPKAEPGGIILLSSKEIQGEQQFTIVNVEHSGDNEVGPFNTTLEVKQ